VSGWQDISSAPKGRTVIILGRPGVRSQQGRWYNDAIPPGFYSDNSGADEFTAKSNPATHWQPLPEPPTPPEPTP
jgi:hypothetical protein